MSIRTNGRPNVLDSAVNFNYAWRMGQNVRKRLFMAGRLFFALAIALFGVQYLVYGRFVGGLLPGQDWTPSMPLIAYLLGMVFVGAGSLMFVRSWDRWSALIVGIILCLGVVLVNCAHIAVVFAHGNERTRAFEPLAVGGAALVLAALLNGDRPGTRALELAGRILFGLSLCVFGLQHYLYTAYIATLLPAWVPAHAALVYVSGTGFIAAGVAIATGIQKQLGAGLLGVMMLLFVVLVQAPPLLAQPTNGDLWTSLYVPLALGGGAWIAAFAPQTRG